MQRSSKPFAFHPTLNQARLVSSIEKKTKSICRQCIGRRKNLPRSQDQRIDELRASCAAGAQLHVLDESDDCPTVQRPAEGRQIGDRGCSACG